MSGQFPLIPAPSSVVVISVTATQSDMSQSGRRNVRILGAQKWSLSCSYPKTLSRNQAMPMIGFMMKQKGQFETFTYIPPDLKEPRGTGAGTPLVDLGSQIGTTINTKGWDSLSEVLKIGDIFVFAGHSKVYMITEDISSDASGLATLVFEPPLMESPVDNESIQVFDVAFTVQMSGNQQTHTVSSPVLYNFSLSLLEAI